MRGRVPAALIVAALAFPGARAADPPKSKSTGGIPARPEQIVPRPLDFQVPDATKFRHQLSNGIPVYVVEDHSLPLVDISLIVRLGAWPV